MRAGRDAQGNVFKRLALGCGIGEGDVLEGDRAANAGHIDADGIGGLGQRRLGIEIAEYAGEQGTRLAQLDPRLEQFEHGPEQLLLQGNQRHQGADGNAEILGEHQPTDEKGQRRQDIEGEHDDGDFPLPCGVGPQLEPRDVGRGLAEQPHQVSSPAHGACENEPSSREGLGDRRRHIGDPLLLLERDALAQSGYTVIEPEKQRHEGE